MNIYLIRKGSEWEPKSAFIIDLLLITLWVVDDKEREAESAFIVDMLIITYGLSTIKNENCTLKKQEIIRIPICKIFGEVQRQFR